MRNVLIVGASQGLGLAFVKHYLAEGARVFAGMRNTGNAAIRALREAYPSGLVPITIDVNETASVEAAFDEIDAAANALDIVVCVAGILPKDILTPLEEFDVDSILPVINTNAVGSLRVAKRAVRLLRNGEDKMFVDISSAGASFSHIIYVDKWPEYPYAYCMSKAALNMGAAILQRYVKPDGIKVLCFHPGLLKSAMWDPELQPYGNKRLSCEESAAMLGSLIDENRHRMDAPFFLNYDGEVFPF